MIFGLMAALFAGYAALVNIVGVPPPHRVRNLDVVRIMPIRWCTGIFFSGQLRVGVRPSRMGGRSRRYAEVEEVCRLVGVILALSRMAESDPHD